MIFKKKKTKKVIVPDKQIEKHKKRIPNKIIF